MDTVQSVRPTDVPLEGGTPARPSLTASDSEEILLALENVASSPYFRNSRRYPAFLRYVVEHTVSGQVEVLKERNIGMAVFGRAPDYDTNYDPIVRIIAGEVRKRLSQYYEGAGDRADIKIQLPTGTYIPEFVRIAKTHQTLSPPPPPVEAPVAIRVAEPRWRSRWIWLLAALLGLLSLGSAMWLRPTGESFVWAPILNTTKPITITVGPPHTSPDATEGDPSIIEHLSNPAGHVSLPSAMALSASSGYLEAHGKQFRVLSASLTSLQDLNSRPVILIGGLNNPWTMRFLAPLRFHFASDPVRIMDTKDPKSHAWAIDLTKPYKAAEVDYALVALFHSQTTDAPVLVIAGVGANATEAASRFLTASDQIARLDGLVRAHPHASNIEVVLKVQSIQGQPGTASIVATEFW